MIVFYIGIIIIKKDHIKEYLGIGKYTFPLLWIGISIENIITLSSSNFPYLVYSAPFLLCGVISLIILSKSNCIMISKLILVNIFYIICLWKDLIMPIHYFYEKNLIVKSIITLKGKEAEWETVHSVFKDYGITRDYSQNQKDFIYCLNILDSLYKIKKRPLVIANFTDLPFETHVPTKRVKGLPLWPDNDVLLFKREKKIYLDLLDKSKFDVIFNHNLDFSGYYFTNHEFMERANINYIELYKFSLRKYEDTRSISLLLPRAP